MADKKKEKRIFQGISYREVQSSNSKLRTKLHKEDQKWLKENGYRNIGWDNIISFYQKIEYFFEKYELEDDTLEELFLEADRIGNKYLSDAEIKDFNKRISKEINEISMEIDKRFPDTEIEFIDFSENSKNSSIEKHKNIKI